MNVLLEILRGELRAAGFWAAPDILGQFLRVKMPPVVYHLEVRGTVLHVTNGAFYWDLDLQEPGLDPVAVVLLRFRRAQERLKGMRLLGVNQS